MTDHELIKQAAKAAGIDLTERIRNGMYHTEEWGWWNPLEDDGDALRLAVQMRLTFAANTVGVIVNTPCGKVFHMKPLEKNYGNMLRAARLAITRAAAECEARA